MILVKSTSLYNIEGQGNATINFDKTSYHIVDSVVLIPVPNFDWIFTGWNGDVQGNYDPLNMILQDALSVTAIFNLADPTSGIHVWYGDHQIFGTLGNQQLWINILGTVFFS